MAKFSVPLAALSRADVARAGGKAANLGELLRAGLPVPDGFCITCDAYRAHLRAHELEPKIAARVSGLDPAQVGTHEAAAADIRNWIEAADLPSEVTAEIAAAYAALGASARVAVRSSATAEDLADASFAGQHDTYLDVAGETAVVDKVRACWASLWTERALTYRRQQGFDREEAAIACVVQRLVPATVAGVAFTADPVTGERDRVIVNAVAGLGEALVSGRTTGDHFVVRKSDGAILQARLAAEGASSGAEPFLADILSLALRVERHYGAPQDIEWAIGTDATQPGAGARTYVLQARPITQLPAEPVSLAAAARPVWGYPVRFREMTPGALSPLGATLFARAFGHMGEGFAARGFLPSALLGQFASIVQARRGRVYVNMSLTRDCMWPVTDEVSLLNRIEGGPHPPLRLGRYSLAALALACTAPPRLLRVFQHLRRLDQHAEEATAAMEHVLVPLERQSLREWSWERLLDLLRGRPSEEVRRALAALFCVNGTAGINAEPYFRFVAYAATCWAGEPETSAARLVSGLPGIVDVECVKTLWDLAQNAAATPQVRQAFERDPGQVLEILDACPEASEWLALFRAFLEQHGHRGISEVDIARPRWREHLAYPLSVIANYLAAGAGSNPHAVERRLAAEREAIEERIVRRLRGRPIRRWLFRNTLATLKKISVARQNTRSVYIRWMALARRAALELGRRLTEQQQLARAEDCFLLDFEGLEAPADFRSFVAKRRTAHAAWQRDVPVRMIDAHGRPIREGAQSTPAAAAIEPSGVLRGIGSSPGTGRGTVRIIRDPSAGARVEPGDVLVAPYTDPAWTPLFLGLAAVVVEVGSMLSHASIVARELGVPAVVGVPGVTDILQNGELVEVDGQAGTVRTLTTAALRA
jgi:pyruvate,water dikinase